MSKFPNIKKLGLSVLNIDSSGYIMPEYAQQTVAYVRAADLEALLSKAVRVYAYMGPAARPGGMWINEGQQDADSTHTALLVGIEPIVRDTAESLLKDLVEAAKEIDSHKLDNVIGRAKRLLERK